MVEVTVLGNGVVEIGYVETPLRRAIRLQRENEEEAKRRLEQYAKGAIDKNK